MRFENRVSASRGWGSSSFRLPSGLGWRSARGFSPAFCCANVKGRSTTHETASQDRARRPSFFNAFFAAAPAWAQLEPVGEWAPRFHEDQPERIPGPEIGDYLGLPINDAARLRGDSWDASLLTLPEHQCKPHPSDYGVRGPANLRIWKEVDTESQRVIAYHTHISWQAPERIIWMDGRPHPPDYAAHTWQGFSTGKWEGDVLTVTTDHLKIGWIRRNGIPRSDRATVTEHWIRHGEFLTDAVIITDPVYLTEPFIRTTDWHVRSAPADRAVSVRIRG